MTDIDIEDDGILDEEQVHVTLNSNTVETPNTFGSRLEPIMLCFWQCSKIQPIMLKIMLSKSRLCLRADCFIRVYLHFLTAVLE